MHSLFIGGANLNVENEAIHVLASVMKDAIKQTISSASYDITLPSVITNIEDGLYTVTINGNSYNIRSSISRLKEGQKVRVTIPCNNWNNMYISNTIDEYDNIISVNKIDGLNTITTSDIDNLF